MGRDGPKERATFSLSKTIKSRLDESVPKSERSRFVEEAIDRALREDARTELANFMNSLPRHSAGSEDSTEVLRRLRRGWDGRAPEVLDGKTG